MSARFALTGKRDCPPFTFTSHLHLTSIRKEQPKMAAKTKTITVQVDERLAAEIEGTTVHNWRTTTFASGKRRVYATFESVKTVGGMK